MCPDDTRADTRSLDVLLTRLDPEVPVPDYSHVGDAGTDLVITRDLVLDPGERAVVGTGIAIALPVGYAAFVHPRSGLAAHTGLGIVNAPGTIDAGYRGELRVCLVNHDLREPVVLHRGDRIAQLVVQRVERVAFREVTELPESSRGTGGYGSTGTAVRAIQQNSDHRTAGSVLASVRTSSQGSGSSTGPGRAT